MMIGSKTFGGYVAPVYMTELELVSAPTKTVYQKGEEFDMTGTVLKAHMSDGTVVDVDLSKVKVLGFASTSKGEKKVTLSYTDENGITLTKVVRVTVVSEEAPADNPTPTKKKGCKSSLESVYLVSVLLLASCLIISRKRKQYI